ncbi:hypothetical protein DPMN_044006 [Dreissena polymorpha]|uniref:Uncharacterized protein n=1 Tax=Dreissena polymorpha TaxID=45954 RepID=A0A9D4D1L6_DREPO|nr:hypothetical protein DPMN_044006 [Dreissena polymorpha]
MPVGETYRHITSLGETYRHITDQTIQEVEQMYCLGLTERLLWERHTDILHHVREPYRHITSCGRDIQTYNILWERHTGI